MPQIPILGSTLKALMRFVPANEIRYYLIGIYFDPLGYAVATDGCVLMAARIAPFDGEGFIVPASAITSALRVKTPAQTRKHTFTVTRDRIDNTPFVPIDGKYPDWRKVVPLLISGKPARYNSEFLERARAALGDLSGTPPVAVLVAENGDKPGVVMNTPAHALIIVMPLAAKPIDSAAAAQFVAAFLDHA